jgi:hypothetical protein
MYVKLFNSILDSSIWAEDHATRIVWIALLAMADRNGFVRSCPTGLAHRARVTPTECRSALKALTEPDLESGSPDYGGARIEAVEGGWVILNYRKYRQTRTADERQMSSTERSRKHRDRKRRQREAAAERQRRKRARDRHALSRPVTDVSRTPKVTATVTETAELPLVLLDTPTANGDARKDASSASASVSVSRIEGSTGKEGGSTESRGEIQERQTSVECVGNNAVTLPALGGRTYGSLKNRLGEVLQLVEDGTISRLKTDELRTLQAELIFAYWQARLNHRGALIDDKRRARIKARLAENAGNVHELLFVVDGTLRDDHLMGRNGKRPYDGIETIFRDRAQVERLAELGRYEPGKCHKMAQKYLGVSQ